MIKHQKFIFFIILFMFIHSNSEIFAKKKVSLDAEYKRWLNIAHHIITPDEKEVFLKLKNNRDRRSFINLFWKMRDPSKGTPENEYKDEHLKRYKYANRYYKHGSPLPGWKTARGKIHIILGPPVSREEITEQNGLYPIEIWEYFGGVEKGLPTAFRMVFYKKHGSGGFRQYIPAVDGPSALLRSGVGTIDTNNNYEVYKEIKELNPTVADIALTLIPGEPLHNYSPSLRGPILMSKVYNYPKKKINANYAKNFLNFKGIVKTYSTTDYISTKSDIYILKDPILGLNFVHIALRPERVSVGYLEDKEKYYLNFNLTVLLKKGSDIILKYDKNFPLYYTKKELDSTISNGLIITDHFPIISGKYKLTTILQNSLNREISYNEKNIIIDEKKSSTVRYPELYRPLVSYKINSNSRMVYSPFKVMNKNIKIDPKRMFGLKDSLTTFFGVERGKYDKNFQVELEIKSLDERRKYQKKYLFTYPKGKKIWYFTKELEKLKYGNYIIKTKVLDKDGKVLNTSQNDFQVSPLSNVPHPPQAFTVLKSENSFIYYKVLAEQYQNNKDLKMTNVFYERAYKKNQSYPALIKSYAGFLIKQKRYDEALAIINGLKKHEKERFSYYALKGRIFYYQKKYQEAIDVLHKANKIFDSDTTVLNTLGFSYVKTGNREEAIRALSASLKVNAYQNNIKDVMKKLKNNAKKK